MRRCICFTNWVFLNFTSPTDRVQPGPQAGSWETTALLGTIRWRKPRSFLFLAAISIPHINMATLQIQKPCHHLGILSHWPSNANLIVQALSRFAKMFLWAFGKLRGDTSTLSHTQIPWDFLHFGTCRATYQEKQLLTDSDQLPLHRGTCERAA